MSDRKARRRAELAARKAETKARLAAPVVPPSAPVALPWRRQRARVVEHVPDRLSKETLAAWRRQQADLWSPIVMGDAGDVAAGLVAAAAVARLVGRLRKG